MSSARRDSTVIVCANAQSNAASSAPRPIDAANTLCSVREKPSSFAVFPRSSGNGTP